MKKGILVLLAAIAAVIAIFILIRGSVLAPANEKQIDMQSEIDKINKLQEIQTKSSTINNETVINNNNNQMDNSDLVKKYSVALIKTSLGDIKVQFYNSDAPTTVGNFLKLSQDGFYAGTKFHRVIKGFMIQGGDPLSKDENMKNRWGTGGPGYKFADEFNSHNLVEGSLAMANSGSNTNGSQFFIVTAASTPWLDGKHTNFGEVVEGMDVVKKIENTEVDERDCPLESMAIQSIELFEK